MKLKDNIENSIFYLRYFFSFTGNFKNPLITICHFKSRTGKSMDLQKALVCHK